ELPGTTAVPVAVTATEVLVLLSRPEMLPFSGMPPPHVAENVPKMFVAVCAAMVNWKSVHDVAVGTAGVADVQAPTRDEPPVVLVLVVVVAPEVVLAPVP